MPTECMLIIIWVFFNLVVNVGLEKPIFCSSVDSFTFLSLPKMRKYYLQYQYIAVGANTSYCRHTSIFMFSTGYLIVCACSLALV